jgi:hypothetical protein
MIKFTNKKMKPLTVEEEMQKRLTDETMIIAQKIREGRIPPPTRSFNIGDPVKIGALNNAVVEEILFGGLAYKIRHDSIVTREVNKGFRMAQVFVWTDVFNENRYKVDYEPFRVVDDIELENSSTDISGLVSMFLNQGIDTNPPYQRDLVWTDSQKDQLLDSIFNNINIGAFCLCRIPHSEGINYTYEIVDGKQRLTTIVDFFLDKFKYRGKLFSELHHLDTYHFMSYPISLNRTHNILTQEKKYRLFIKMNTCGTPMPESHINHVKSLITNK